MKAFQYIRVVIILVGILLSACSAAPSSSSVPARASAGGDKPVSEVVFTGVIEGINGDQWTINGQTVTVDSSILRDGPFTVGNTVKVEARVAADGSVTAQRVETPASVVPAMMVSSAPDAASTQAPAVPANVGNETVGTVESMTDTTITIDGQTYSLAPGTEIKGAITPGTIVKLHFITNADGTFTASEIGADNPALIGGSNSSDDNTGSSSVNDDQSSSHSSNDQAGDDHGGDNHSNDDSGKDDHGSGGGSSDDGSGHG